MNEESAQELLSHARRLLLSIDVNAEPEVRVAAARAMIELAREVRAGNDHHPAPHPMLQEVELESSDAPALTLADDPSFGD